MTESTENVEDAVDTLEKEMMSFCNLIPINAWGFDDDVKESLKMRKHSLVNRQLSKKERKSMSAQQKQQLAKGLGLVPNTVQEVLEWMSNSKQHSKVQPQKSAPAPVKREKPVAKKPEKKAQEKVEKEDPDAESGDSEDSEEEAEESDAEEAQEPAAKKQKKEESSDDEEEEKEEEEDSTDEESEEPVAKKAKIIAPSTLKTNDKIDNEIKKLEADEDSESPEIKRQIALLRLQKKLKEMKQERKGKGPAKVTPAMAAKLTEEKRLKRRESKLKLKQRRAEEKKGKETTVKKEDAVEGEENGEKTEEKKKSNISFNNLKFEIKQDKQRGKKQRTAKKDRGLKLTGRDYKSLIAKVEETKATIAKVREADPHKATIMEDELKWEKTLKRAAGGKVKDNLTMLKKALAKKNKLKERKKEKWENRQAKVDGEKQTKQEKRKNNLQKRIDDVKKRKLNKLRQKGRVL